MHIAMALFSAAMFFVLAGVFGGRTNWAGRHQTGGGYRRRRIRWPVDLYRYGGGFLSLLRPMFRKR